MKQLTTFLTGVTNPDPLVRRSSSKRRLRTLPIAGLLRRRCQYFRSMRSPCSPDNGDRLRKPPFKFHRGLSLTLLLLADLILVVTLVRHNNTRHRVLLALTALCITGAGLRISSHFLRPAEKDT